MNGKRPTLYLALVLAFLVQLVNAAAAQSGTRKPWPQNFICNGGYTQSECHRQLEVLRAAFRKYPTSDLGDWTWVVVRSNDWKRLLSDRRFAPEIPAFTYLPGRETFFDEALLQPSSFRGVELAMSWHMTIPELLDLAVRHEMGHALCNEQDEVAAMRTAQLLLDLPKLSAVQACVARRPYP